MKKQILSLVIAVFAAIPSMAVSGPGKVVIRSFKPLGVIRAKQTLAQLQALDPQTECGRIFDYPRFRHRGLPEGPDGPLTAFRNGLIDNPFQYKP